MSVIEPSEGSRYWLCRPGARGHNWDYNVNIPYVRKSRGRTWSYHESKRCKRCKTVCHTLYDVWYNVIGRVYKHPPGYSYSQDEQPTTQQLRRYKLEHREDR